MISRTIKSCPIIPSSHSKTLIQVLNVSKIVLVLIFLIHSASGSTGDRLAYYHECMSYCVESNCSSSRTKSSIVEFLGWTCTEECRHKCQFDTIEYLFSLGIKPEQVPQFYGKWTFRRILGAQEPASTFFSFLNLFTTFFGFKYFYYEKIRKKFLKLKCGLKVSNKSSSVLGLCSEPYFLMTFLSCVLGLNAWFWSMIFHYHDSPMTEKFDYFSASSLVLYNLYYVLIRVLELFGICSRTSKFLNRKFFGAIFVSYICYHFYYLNFIKFDYGYNMKVNIAAGIFTSIFWFIWSAKRMKQLQQISSSENSSRTKFEMDGNHIKNGIFCIIALNVSLLLEVTDFPPILNYTLDSHALWHLATFPIPIFWFRFLADDAICNNKDSSLSASQSPSSSSSSLKYSVDNNGDDQDVDTDGVLEQMSNIRGEKEEEEKDEYSLSILTSPSSESFCSFVISSLGSISPLTTIISSSSASSASLPTINSSTSDKRRRRRRMEITKDEDGDSDEYKSIGETTRLRRGRKVKRFLSSNNNHNSM